MSSSNTQFTQSALQNPLFRNTQVGPVRVVASSNQTGTYLNGPTNNGVGATFTFSTGALTIDSVALNLNDYFLLAGQSLGYQNGIYQVTQLGATGISAVGTRRADYQSIEQIKTGFYVPVYAGTVNAGSNWMLVEPAPAGMGVPAVSGANNLNYISSAVANGSLLAANNLSDVANAATSLANLGVHSAHAGTAGGSASDTFTDARILTTSIITTNFVSQTNVAYVLKVAAGAGSFTVTYNTAPGTSVLAYIATNVQI